MELSSMESRGKDSGQERLEAMGYKQELKRGLTVVDNFGVSFGLLAVLAGITILYNTGLSYGGTVSIVYGWLLAGLFNVFVALSMGEIFSAFPTSGGLYYWSFNLAGSKWGPFASWMTGWFNLLGQWVGTASLNFSLAQLLQVMILLSTGGDNGGGYYLSKYEVVGIHAGILIAVAIMNSSTIRWLAYVAKFAIFWNCFGLFILMVLIPTVAVEKSTAKFVFTSLNTRNSHGITSPIYAFSIGLLMAQFSLCGYDCSVHISEETKGADRTGAYGLVGAVVIAVLVGWAYILGVTFAVVDPDHLLDPNNDAGGYAIAQLFYDVFKERYGHGTWGIVCLGVVALDISLCGIMNLMSNSRMVYAFSRDGAMPLSETWHLLDKRGIPLPAVWLSASVAIVIALTYLFSVVAFQAMASIATSAYYISYAVPIALRVTIGHKSFVHGPFNLGKLGRPIGTLAVVWVAVTSVIFCLPVAYPITRENFNYTPIVLGIALVLTVGSWLSSARYWFTGPRPNLDQSLSSRPIS